MIRKLQEGKYQDRFLTIHGDIDSRFAKSRAAEVLHAIKKLLEIGNVTVKHIDIEC